MRRIIGLALAVLFLAACSVKVGNISDAATPVPAGQIVFTQTSYSCAAGGTSFGFVAYFNDNANGSTLRGTIGKLETGGAETAISDTEIPTPNGNEDQISNADVAVSSICGDSLGAGTYVMHIVRPSDSIVLASGQYVLVP